VEIRETETLKRLEDFIRTERDRFEVKSNNLFAQSFSRIAKIYRYLMVIEDRYTLASEAFMENTRLMNITVKEGNHPLTPEQESLHEQSWKLNVALELEIDSFYIFSKMLLDRIAHGIELYFGQSTRCSLESHKEMSKCFPEYIEAKTLSAPPARLMELLKILKEDIRDYRDHEIVHAKNV